ncbi:hypothetical protein Tco_1063202, partial [Tanacetum coccineum]
SMDRGVIEEILQILPFKRGKLPVRYLGVPLVSKKIGVKDSSALASIQVYWASVFKLPKLVIDWSPNTFGNDHFGAIMGYGDYIIGDSVISMVYYVEGLRHNLFSVRQFCNSDLEVVFRKHSCYVRDVNGVELIKGNRGTNLYTISVEDMIKSSPICLLSKASKNKSWLWHR